MHLKILIGVLTLELALAKPQSADLFGKDASDVLPKDPTSGIFNTYIIHPSTGQSSSLTPQEIIRPSLTTIFQLFRPMISLINPSLLHLNTNPAASSPPSFNNDAVQTNNRLNQNVPQSAGVVPAVSPPRVNPTVAETSSSPSVPETPVQTNPVVTNAPVSQVQTTLQPEQTSSSIAPSVSTETTTTSTTTAAKNDDEDYYSYNYNDDDD